MNPEILEVIRRFFILFTYIISFWLFCIWVALLCINGNLMRMRLGKKNTWVDEFITWMEKKEVK